VAIAVRPVTADRWDDLAELFGPQGAYSGCWCMFFRTTSSEFADGNAANRRRMTDLVSEGACPGLLAYGDGEQPVGWVSVAPRSEYGRIVRSPVVGPGRGPVEERVWSIVCFYVPKAHRRRGIARALLDGAVDHAARNGASSVEAYPRDPSVSEVTAAGLYVGDLDWFLDAGFEEVERRKAARPIVQRRL
jgi:GNAT superfamily N-acetyltransferase